MTRRRWLVEGLFGQFCSQLIRYDNPKVPGANGSQGKWAHSSVGRAPGS